MFNRPLPAPARDIALLIGRVVLGVVLFAHGWQKLMITGIAGTYGQFEKMGIPLAIVSASFTSFVEFVGGALLIVGALTTTVVALDLVVMVGAAGFVHITHGVFAQDGGWELVGVIVAAELALAATGPGRFSVDHLISSYRSRQDAALEKVKAPVHRAEGANSGTFAAMVRQTPGRAPQHIGPAQGGGPRYGGAGQVGRVRLLEQPGIAPPRTMDDAWAAVTPRPAEQPRFADQYQGSDQPWAPVQRPAVGQPLTAAQPITTSAQVEAPAQVEQVDGSAQAQSASDEHWVAEQSRIVEQSGGYTPVAGFQPNAAYDPAPMFDPAQRFAAARLLDPAPVTDQLQQVGEPVEAGTNEPAPTPKADAAPDVAPNVAAALTIDEPRRTAASRKVETPRLASELPQRAPRGERVRMASTPFQ